MEFFIVSDCQKDVPWDYPGLLVVFGCVSCQFQHFGGQILENCSEVDGCPCSHSFGVPGVSEESANSADRELESCP